MSLKNWAVGAALIVFSTGMVFANGTVDDQRYGGRRDRGNPGGGNYNRSYMDNLETESFEGTFSLVDGRYPAMITDKGETFYLMVHDMDDAGTIPEEGARLSIEAIRSPMSPVNLMVVSAKVDGVELELDQDTRGPYGGRHGGPGMMGGRNDAGRGPKPGWGYPDSDPEDE